MPQFELPEKTISGKPLTIAGLSDQAQRLLRQGWTKGTIARDSRGDALDCDDPNAVSWCLIGSINRAYYDLTGRRPNYTGPYREFWERIEAGLLHRYGHKDLVEANDAQTTVSPLLALLRDARFPQPPIY